MFQATQNHSSVEAIVVKLQWKMCENQYFPCFEPWINNHLSQWNSSAVISFSGMLSIIKKHILLVPMCCTFWEICINSRKTGQGCSNPLIRSVNLIFLLTFWCLYLCMHEGGSLRQLILRHIFFSKKGYRFDLLRYKKLDCLAKRWIQVNSKCNFLNG